MALPKKSEENLNIMNKMSIKQNSSIIGRASNIGSTITQSKNTIKAAST